MALKNLFSWFSVEEYDEGNEENVQKSEKNEEQEIQSITPNLGEATKRNYREKGKVVSLHGAVKNLQVQIIEPSHYADSQEVSEFLRDNCSVVVNLHLLNEAQSRRVLDFLTGFIYAINGDIQRIGNNIFLCTPETVSIMGEITEPTMEDAHAE